MTQVLRVLVVDDDPGALLTFAANLELAGLVAVTADSSEAALTAMNTQGPFDLVVTDLRLGKLDGLAFLRRLRILQPGVPVILATAHVAEEQVMAFLAEGVYTVITKPFEVDDAVGIIARAAKRPIVLVADDGPAGAAMVSALTAMGLNSKAVKSAGEALLVIGLDGVDVCVARVGLGEKDGATLPERIRSTKRDVAVIGIADGGGDELVRRAARAGAFAFLAEPVDSLSLAQMIARARSIPPAR